MADDKKWKIEGLSEELPFSSAAKIILQNRAESVISSIKTYFEEDTPETLHEIRISLRRLRYTMEVFYICFNPRKFNSLYKSIKQIQDLSGLVRDLDVMKENMQLLSDQEKVKIPKKILDKIDETKDAHTDNLKLKLMKFYHNKRLKKIL